MDTKLKLDMISNFNAQKDVMMMDKQALVDSVLTPEIKAKLAEIDAEFAGKTEVVDANIAALQEEVEAEVLAQGATVKGTYMMAVWNKGRSGGWDDGKLQGFAMAHPEIMSAKKPDGKPSIAFRKI
jgi:hypothetical protein